MPQAKRKRTSSTRTAWAPVVDICETDKEFLIRAELPDVRKRDLRIAVRNGVVTVRGERRLNKEQKTRGYHCIERAYGSFVGRFVLPSRADARRVRAEFKAGVLRLHLPKSQKANHRPVASRSSHTRRKPLRRARQTLRHA